MKEKKYGKRGEQTKEFIQKLLNELKNKNLGDFSLKDLLTPDGYAERVVKEAKLPRVQLRKIYAEFKRLEDMKKRKEKDEMIKRLKQWGGNSAGKRLGNINFMGIVKPDRFFPFDIGDMNQRNFDEIWLDKDNEILTKLSQKPRNISGICAECGVKDICNGGSRSRAYALSGDLWSEDPSCYLTQEERRSL